MTPHDETGKRFNLLRWFAVLSCLTIVLSTIVTGIILSRFLTDKLLGREASVMMEFISSILRVEEADTYFEGQQNAGFHGDTEEFFKHLAELSGVLRANVYTRDRKIFWSSDPKLIGKEFELNEELEVAFLGEPKISIGLVGREEKEEHVFFEMVGQRFIESYLPVKSSKQAGNGVIAVVEIYRSPEPLFEAIEQGARLMWLSAIGGGVFLFAVLFWVVRRADIIMRRQEADLVQSEKLAVTVEMVSAIAHSLRNPLASIRSSAELALISHPEGETTDQLRDIMGQTDRLAQWISQYLVQTSPEISDEGVCNIDQAIAASLDNFKIQFQSNGIQPALEIAPGLPQVGINDMIITQVLNGLISNAIEAMSAGGSLTIRAALNEKARKLTVLVHNPGKGLTEDEIENAFQPFTTSKTGGLGMGLPLARRIITRLGGELTLSSKHGGGVTAFLSIPVME